MKTLTLAMLGCLTATVYQAPGDDRGGTPPRDVDWPQFRGPAGDGTSGATNVPVEWDGARGALWRTAAPGEGWSSPVASENRIVLTSAAESEDRTVLKVSLFDAATGELRWEREVFQPEPDETKAAHRKNSLASSTPVIDGGRVYAHFGHMGTAALDLESGEELWRQKIEYRPVHGNGSSPVLADGRLIFNADGQSDPEIVALDADTGRVAWRTPRTSDAQRKFSFSTPLVISNAGRKEVVSAGSGMVGGYRAEDGQLIWRVNFGQGYSVVPRPVYGHGLIFVGTGFDRPTVIAIRADGERGDLTESHVEWQISRSAPNTPSMVLEGAEIYFVSDGGIATCADARTGQVHWNERLGGNYSASPVAAEGRIYFASEEGVVTVVKAAPDEFAVLARNDMEERIFASPAVSDGTLLLRTEGHLWRIDTEPRL